MWPTEFESRLQRWYDLRSQGRDLSLDLCLDSVNRFWMSTPWTPYSLHWDDRRTWPDPWQLLQENVFCDLARSLGIVYTVLLIDHKDIEKIEIADTDLGNLVLVDSGKYILNWVPDEILNNPSKQITVRRRLDSSELVHLLG